MNKIRRFHIYFFKKISKMKITQQDISIIKDIKKIIKKYNIKYFKISKSEIYYKKNGTKYYITEIDSEDEDQMEIDFDEIGNNYKKRKFFYVENNDNIEENTFTLPII